VTRTTFNSPRPGSRCVTACEANGHWAPGTLAPDIGPRHQPAAVRKHVRLAPGIVGQVALDVSDARFRAVGPSTGPSRSRSWSNLWAPWCGRAGPWGRSSEDVVDATGGAVELAKVNVDENPRISGAFQVQSIPAVMAIKDRKVVDGFIGAVPRAEVEQFVARLTPQSSEADQLAACRRPRRRFAARSRSNLTIALRVVGLARILIDGGAARRGLHASGAGSRDP